MAQYFIMTGVYPYLEKILKLNDYLDKAKLELEKNLKLIKDMAPALVGINVL